MLYAEVAVEAARSLDRETYTYSVPEALEVVPGHRVTVPFGRRSATGYVVSIGTEPPDVEVKDVERADTEALFLPHQVELAKIVAGHYWVPVIECLLAMLPPRVRGGGGGGESLRQRRHSRLLEIARNVAREPGPELTPDQQAAVAAVARGRATLLHRVAASGKTEVYLAAAEAAVDAGSRVLILVPEISLTPQLVERFARRAGCPIAVLHSRLTALERAQQWWRVRRGEAALVIGSRSAVFAPIPRLGLICLDEEGSPAYKQDRTPRYEAGWVARRLARLTGARLILGSATPSVATYHEAESGRLALSTLPRRVVGKGAAIELVDMRDEVAEGNRQPVSRRLFQVVERALGDEEQVILFLNRRGLATFILCRECGRSVQCPQCSVAMVQHPEMAGLSCHYCGATRPLPAVCPYCGSRHIRGLGVGTQRLEGIARRLWPGSRVLRLDSDSARGPDAYLELFEEFAEGRADILVGTQMVTRGLDLERVTAVGVVDADLPLHFPDYLSAENTFSLVTQVAGRAGRGRREATVVVQTSNPDHYSLRRAAEGDYLGFYREELPAREVFGFPPFAELAVITYSNEDAEKAAATARDGGEALAARILAARLEGIRVMGPSPAFVHRVRGEYRWQITVRGRELERLRGLLPRGRGWSFDVDPRM